MAPVAKSINPPDAEPLLNLLKSWHNCFDSQFTTVRKAVEKKESFNANDTCRELSEALKEFPVVEKGSLNRSKIGWILKKNAGRIIDDYRFERGESDGRTAWLEADCPKIVRLANTVKVRPKIVPIHEENFST